MDRGQLIPRGPGVWLVRVYRGRIAGKRQYVSKTVRGTEREAQKLLTKMLSERDAGTLAQPSRQTVAVYMREWLEHTARPRVSQRTLRDYAALTERYVVPSLGSQRVDRLSAADVQAFYGSLSARGLSPRVVRFTHAVLRSALKQGVRWGLIPRNPCDLVTLPKFVRRELRYMDPNEAARFVAASAGDRWEALWLVLLFGGIRPGEAAALRWADLDGTNLRVNRALTFGYKGSWSIHEPKTSRSRRTVPLPPSVVKVLTDHKRRQAEERLRAGPAYDDGGFIFASSLGAPVDIRTLRRSSFHKILAVAKIPHLRMYDLRHTCASLMLANGTNAKVVSERLGHSTITLTMDTYSAVLPTMQEEATAKLERLVLAAR